MFYRAAKRRGKYFSLAYTKLGDVGISSNLIGSLMSTSRAVDNETMAGVYSAEVIEDDI